MKKLIQAAKNVLLVGVPIILVAAVIIALYNTNPTKYSAMLQGIVSQFPSDAQTDLFARLHLQGGNRTYSVISAQHATKPARHWNPMINKALDMWCVVVDPPSEILVSDAGNRPLRSFLVYQTRPGAKWLVTDGIEVFQTDQKEFQDVGCTNYQN